MGDGRAAARLRPNSIIEKAGAKPTLQTPRSKQSIRRNASSGLGELDSRQQSGIPCSVHATPVASTARLAYEAKFAHDSDG